MLFYKVNETPVLAAPKVGGTTLLIISDLQRCDNNVLKTKTLPKLVRIEIIMVCLQLQ